MVDTKASEEAWKVNFLAGCFCRLHALELIGLLFTKGSEPRRGICWWRDSHGQDTVSPSDDSDEAVVFHHVKEPFT